MKRPMLALALIATVAAAYFAPAAEEAAVVPTQRAPAAAPLRAGPVPEVLAIRPRERHDEHRTGGTFAGRWWVPPPAPVAVQPAAAPVEPSASAPPPLPFRVLGRYVDGDETTVFLLHNDQNLVARVGETLVTHYRVEKIDDAALTLRYVPLDLLQTLDVAPPK